MSKLSKWSISLVLGILVVAILGVAGSLGYLHWYLYTRPIEVKADVKEPIIKIYKGTTVRDIAKQMNEKSDINPTIATHAFEYLGADKSIETGWYQFEPGWTLEHIINQIKNKKYMKSRYTVVEGTRTNYLFDRLQENQDLTHPEEPLTPNEIMEKVGAPEGTFPEGQFAADTYIFKSGSFPEETLKLAYDLQQKRLAKAWKNRDPNIAVKSPYELLILASIIEKETGNPEDRSLISSVFNNRLKKGMLLQTDPTVIYGIQNFQGKILKSHLKTDHPYNTYIHAGLPPTPIAIPGKAAIEAAAHPADTNYLYFVAKADGSGKSYFSSTLKEHNEAVQKYLRSQGK